MPGKVDVPFKCPSFFRECGLFDGIGHAEVEQVIAQLAPRHVVFSDGEQICRFGESADCLWIVYRGDIGVSMAADDADRHLVIRRGPCVVGEQAFVEGTRRASMKAIGRVEAYTINRTTLDAVVDPEFKVSIWRNLAVTLSRKLSQASEGRAALSAANSDAERLLKLFVNEYGLGHVRGHLRMREDYRGEAVVVWFSDLVGFGAVVHQTEMAKVARLVRECMRAQSKAIEDHDGYIDKFMGDGLMAFWIVQGGEVGRQRACAQAMAAAHAAIAAVGSIPSPIEGHRVGLRIGLHTGHAISGNFGSDNRWAFTLIGEDVNIAARLEQAKAVEAGDVDLGPIRVSEAFRNALPGVEASLRLRSTIKVKELHATIYSGPAPLGSKEHTHG